MVDIATLERGSELFDDPRCQPRRPNFSNARATICCSPGRAPTAPWDSSPMPSDAPGQRHADVRERARRGRGCATAVWRPAFSRRWPPWPKKPAATGCGRSATRTTSPHWPPTAGPGPSRKPRIRGLLAVLRPVRAANPRANGHLHARVLGREPAEGSIRRPAEPGGRAAVRAWPTTAVAMSGGTTSRVRALPASCAAVGRLGQAADRKVDLLGHPYTGLDHLDPAA